MGSRLREKNLLNENVRISCCNREKDLFKFISDEDGLIYCKDVNKLMKVVGHKHIASEWRLCIDSNKSSLKGVLLHNGNKFPSIPVAYASHLKECYEVMKMLLLKINYHAHFWSIFQTLTSYQMQNLYIKSLDISGRVPDLTAGRYIDHSHS